MPGNHELRVSYRNLGRPPGTGGRCAACTGEQGRAAGVQEAQGPAVVTPGRDAAGCRSRVQDSAAVPEQLHPFRWCEARRSLIRRARAVSRIRFGGQRAAGASQCGLMGAVGDSLCHSVHGGERLREECGQGCSTFASGVTRSTSSCSNASVNPQVLPEAIAPLSASLDR